MLRRFAPLVVLPLVLAACSAARRPAAPAPAASSAAPVVTPLVSGTTALLIGLSVSGDGRTVWASGAAGTFARSADGGATWAAGRVPGADTLQFRDVEAFSDREAVMLSIGSGAASRIVRTGDGGATWTTAWVNDEPTAFYDCLAFHDARRGVAVSDAVSGPGGARLPTLLTTDGGRTWQAPAAPIVARTGEGGFASSGTCAIARGERAWIVTNGGGPDDAPAPDRVLRTEDAGRTWQSIDTPFRSADGSRGLATIAHGGALMLAGSLGAIDGQTMLRSTDDGRTWAVSPRTVIDAVYGLALGANGRHALAVGPGGLDASRDGGQTWRHLSDTVYWTAAALPGGAFLVAGRGGALARVTF